MIPRRRLWEYALLAPQRIATYPISAVGNVLDRGLLWVESTALVSKIGYVARVVPERTGITVRQASLGDRTGLAGTVRASTPFFGGRLKNFLTISHSASTRNYHDTRVGLTRGTGMEYAYLWRPQERFYGLGMDSDREDISDYAMHVEQGIVRYSFRWNRDVETPRPRTELAMWIGSRATILRTGRDDTKAPVETVFPGVVASTMDRAVEHLTYGARFASDWRQGGPHWFHGWRVLGQFERFDQALEFLALRTTREGAQFTRTTLEFESGTSFMREPRTLRVLWRVVDHGISSGDERMLLADYAQLGGREGLRGFQPDRFHDIDGVLGRVSWIFPLVQKLEMDVHAEAGGVFGNVWTHTRLDRLRTSYGVALRGRTPGGLLGTLGVDWSKESTRLRYSLGNPESIGFRD